MATVANVTLALTFNYEHLTNGVSITKVANAIVGVNLSSNITHVQNIGIADEVLQTGDVAPTGYAVFHNLDTVNAVLLSDINMSATNSPLKLKAGEWSVVRWNSATVHAKALVAPIDLEYVLLPD